MYYNINIITNKKYIKERLKDMTDLEMIKELEEARLASTEPNPFPVYALSNGNKITWYRSYNYDKMKNYLQSLGFWVCSIFENGHRVEA